MAIIYKHTHTYIHTTNKHTHNKYTHTHIYIYIYKYVWIYVFKEVIAQSAGAVEYTNCFSAEGNDSPPTHTNKCIEYDTKQSDGEVPLMLGLWGMRRTPSLPSLPGPLWPGVVAPDNGPIYGLNRTKP